MVKMGCCIGLITETISVLNPNVPDLLIGLKW
jgi:hypothetical protein